MAKIIKRLEEYPEWREMSAKLQDLKKRHQAADKRVQALTSQHLAGGAPMAVSELQERARALVDGDVVDSRPFPGDIERNLAAERDERAVLAEAVRLQERALDRLRTRLSAEICEPLRSTHHQMVYRIQKALKELAEACAAEHDLRMDLRDSGIQHESIIPPMEFSGLGRLDEHNSRVSMFLRECERMGFPTP